MDGKSFVVSTKGSKRMTIRGYYEYNTMAENIFTSCSLVLSRKNGIHDGPRSPVAAVSDILPLTCGDRIIPVQQS